MGMKFRWDLIILRSLELIHRICTRFFVHSASDNESTSVFVGDPNTPLNNPQNAMNFEWQIMQKVITDRHPLPKHLFLHLREDASDVPVHLPGILRALLLLLPLLLMMLMMKGRSINSLPRRTSPPASFYSVFMYSLELWPTSTSTTLLVISRQAGGRRYPLNRRFSLSRYPEVCWPTHDYYWPATRTNFH